MISREFLYSYLLILMVWFLVLFPKAFNFLPKLWAFKAKQSLHHLLPPIPSSMSQAFKLGRLQQELSMMTKQNTHHINNTSQTEEILQKATEILDTKQRHKSKFTEAAQLNNLLHRIEEFENKRSFMQKIFGLFSFINIIWFLSILGILYSLFPVIYHTFKPIYDFLLRILSGFIQRLLRQIFLSDFAFEVYEFLLYTFPFYIIYLASIMQKNHKTLRTRFFIAFTGMMSYIPVFIVSNIYLNHSFEVFQLISGHGAAPHKMFEEQNKSWFMLLFALLNIPLVSLFESKLFSFISVYGMYYYFGFFVQSFYGGYVIGFHTAKQLENCIVVSLFLSITMICIRFIHAHHIFNVFLSDRRMNEKNHFQVILYRSMKYFESPLIIMSNVVLFLGLLIYSNSYWYCFYNHQCNYWVAQLWFIACTIVAVFFGHYLSYPSMISVAYVFAVLYVMAKSLEFDILWKGKIYWYSIFISSAIYYKLALYLHANPAIIVDAFKWQK